MKKGNFISAVIASAVLFSGTAALAAYTYLKKGKHDEEPAEEAVEEAAEEAAEVAEEAAEEAEEAAEVAEEAAEEAEDVAEEAEEIAEEAEEAAEFAEYSEPAEPDLEAYLAEHPEEKDSLKGVSDSFSADGVRTDISVTGNTMFFDFVMTDVEDDDTAAALKPDLEGFLDDQSEAYSDIVNTIEEETGIDGVKMIVIFMDDNENEIVSGHYDNKGRVL